MSVIEIHKNVGETMGMLLVRFKAEHHIPDSVPVTYAGRLDPAAEGICVFLTGTDVYRKDEYLEKNKTYLVSVVVGIRTDTDDLLGVVQRVFDGERFPGKNPQDFCPETIDAFRHLPKTVMQQPHPFSSYRILGKPLWAHTKAGAAKAAPAKKRTIFDVQFSESDTISANDLREGVAFLCKSVEGDFRQQEILDSWRHSNLASEYPVITFELSVSAGTYIRSLVHTVSNTIGVPLVVARLIRTHLS
jgi:tRNA pseudouridine55 synthase